MLKKSIAVVFAIVFAMTATVASAQMCTVAAYGDPEGTTSLVQPIEGQFFSFFVVMFSEDTLAAAAYKMTVSGENIDVFKQGRIAGPNGLGLFLDENPPAVGTNVALGECAIGFGGLPVLIEEYLYFAVSLNYTGTVTLGPNTNQNPDFPEYVTCTDVQKDCTVGPTLFIAEAIPTDATSFGQIKSLYN
jgi:hypothetical protein